MIIKLNDFDKIKKFANTVCAFEEPIELSKEGDNVVYNAKSILSLFAMDLSSPLNARIITNNAERVAIFERELAEFVED